ncbi:MAG: hypothetical protein LAO31_23010 [Acidobacteriia bacterium]|nr:hypothetical protein [Terriglobia bacterium]
MRNVLVLFIVSICFVSLASAQAVVPGWQAVDGSLKQTSTDDTMVWGVNAGGEIYRRPVDGSGTWERVAGALEQVSASGKGWIWGVNKNNQIYRCAKPCPASGSGWQLVDGAATQVSADDTSVWVIQPSGSMWRRPVDGSGAWTPVSGEG